MNNTGAPIIQVSDLTAAYGENVILAEVGFEIYRGEIFAILGNSGCGKTTLLKQMIGLETPRAGQILIDGDDIVRAQGSDLIKILRKFGVMYQSGALFGSMTLMENIGLVLEEFTDLPPAAIELITRMKLKLVGLSGYGHYLPAEISGGMRKRAAIARAMALDPMILFLDELSAGLDPITSAGLDQLILRLARDLNMTIVIITHELPSIFTVADRVIMLDKEARGIIASGHPQDLKDHSHNTRVLNFFNRQSEW